MYREACTSFTYFVQVSIHYLIFGHKIEPRLSDTHHFINKIGHHGADKHGAAIHYIFADFHFQFECAIGPILKSCVRRDIGVKCGVGCCCRLLHATQFVACVLFCRCRVFGCKSTSVCVVHLIICIVISKCFKLATFLDLFLGISWRGGDRTSARIRLLHFPQPKRVALHIYVPSHLVQKFLIFHQSKFLKVSKFSQSKSISNTIEISV